MLRYRDKLYIANGNSVNPDWTDRIIFSRFPSSGYAFPTASVIAAAAVTISDIPTGTYTLTPVSFAKDYWELYDNSNTLDGTNNAYIKTFSATQAGDFMCRVVKTAGVDAISQFYIGRHGSISAGKGSSEVFVANNETDLAVTFDETALTTYSFNGHVRYSKNVALVDAAQSIAVGVNEKVTTTFPAATYPVFSNTENRVYIKELGCFYDGVDTASNVWEAYSDLQYDWSVRKSDIISIRRRVSGGGTFGGEAVPVKHEIILTLDADEVVIDLDSIANQTSWTNDLAGLQAAFSDISAWIS